MLLMFASFLDPPFCAHVARSSAALLPSCPEWPFTFTHRVITFLSITACTSRLHTAITVAFFTCRACPGGLGAVHWSLVYCESYTIITPTSSLCCSCSPFGAMLRVLHVSIAAMMCGTADSSAVLFDIARHPRKVSAVGSSCTGPYPSRSSVSVSVRIFCIVRFQ